MSAFTIEAVRANLLYAIAAPVAMEAFAMFVMVFVAASIDLLTRTAVLVSV